METAVTIGLDLGKSVFQVHGVDARGAVVVQRRLTRSKLLAFFGKQPACLVGMEACAAAHHWGRELQKLGHAVRLMPPSYVKPYVKRQKNDAADAEAICEAVTRPNMRFVEIKTCEQQGTLVLNSSFGIGPDFSQSGQNGPSIFPSTGLGLVGWWLPGDHWQVKAGVFEGASGDPMHPGRTRFMLSRDEGALIVLEARNHITENFVLGAGAWRYTASFPALDPTRVNLSGNAGYYAIADGLLYAAPEGEGAGLSGWLRFGWADARINPIAETLNGGLVYSAPFGREKDQVGVSVAWAWFGAPARDILGMGVAETTWEATYSFAVNSHFSFQPDIQYVMSPSGGPTPDALVLGSRITASW